MTVLQVDHVSFGYDAETLFEDVSFSLTLGERLALVAPNGQGKSTLLKLIAGTLEPDEGRVLIPKGVRVSYLHQSHEPKAGGTVLDVLLEPFVEARQARAELSAAEHAAASGTALDLDRLSRAQDRFHAVGADAVEREVSTIAQKVGFRDQDLSRTVSSLSGGERGRLQLAAVLASKPDLLLLDEPTNHLDLETVEWLEGFLRGFRAGLIVVSHDRAFLDATCNKTAELGLLKFRFYHARYSDYPAQREADLERERKEVLAQRAEIARTEEFIRKNIAGQGTNQAKSRRKMLEKLVRLDNPEDIWADAKKLGLRFSPARRTGEVVLEAQGLCSERGGRKLFQGLDLRVKRLDRWAIVGPNGSGKSTLLKLLAGQRMESDRGEVRLGSNVDLGYFDQHLEALSPQNSCIDEVRSVRPDMVVDSARQYLSRFRFWGDDPFRAVGSLSGGERTRLALAKLLLVPRNVLLLDEPTNHLDIPACEILEEALVHFEGTVILVSHDRYFLERVATRVLHLESGSVELYNSTYGDYTAHRAKMANNARGFQSEMASKPQNETVGDRSHRKVEYEAARKNAREAEKRIKRIAELDRWLADGQVKLTTLRAQLASAPGEEWERVAAMAEEEQALVTKMDQWTEEWMRLSEENG
jgi:ATP-binding cassette, subfamily F, member 3